MKMIATSKVNMMISPRPTIPLLIIIPTNTRYSKAIAIWSLAMKLKIWRFENFNMSR